VLVLKAGGALESARQNHYTKWNAPTAILVEAARKQSLDLVSLVISSIEPAPVMPKVWPREEQTAYY
jgi:hypothetical protein